MQPHQPEDPVWESGHGGQEKVHCWHAHRSRCSSSHTLRYVHAQQRPWERTLECIYHTVHPLDEMNLHLSLAAVQLGFLSSFLNLLFRILSKLVQFSLLCFFGVASHCPQRVPWYCYMRVQFTARNMYKKNTVCLQNAPFVFLCVMLHS